MRKLSLKILGGLVIAICLLHNSIAIAATKSELNNNQAETQKKIEDTKKELNGIQTEKSETLKQVEELTGQISEYETQIRKLNQEIDGLNEKIKQEETNLKKAEEDYTKQEKLLEDRLVATYEAGETSYLDFILSSASITELISNYYLVTEVATSDTELLEKIQNQKKEIEEAKAKLEDSKKELDTSKASKQQVSTQLQNSKKEKNSQVAKLNQEEKQTQAELDQFEADKREIQAELAAIAAQEKKAAEEANKNNNSNTGGNTSNSGNNGNTSGSNSGSSGSNTPSASGFVFPVSGLSKANIANKNFPSYKGHTGIDVNINVTGKTIVAAKGGTVQRSKAYIKDGKYYSYGECIVINHGGGVATLYAHGLPGSRRVTVGQTVQAGQAIMTVGTTGNSSGDHLHFEVLINGNPVNPLPYLP
ncbi:MAG: peptidoglycan DD-metalloendopeptidase family protein [Clostridia bacterium]|nr:peptidoglycan DD-metalloendopeptidase family protein [Clostridia bacterium]